MAGHALQSESRVCRASRWFQAGEATSEGDSKGGFNGFNHLKSSSSPFDLQHITTEVHITSPAYNMTGNRSGEGGKRGVCTPRELSSISCALCVCVAVLVVVKGQVAALVFSYLCHFISAPCTRCVNVSITTSVRSHLSLLRLLFIVVPPNSTFVIVPLLCV